jgi:hypothetical protein
MTKNGSKTAAAMTAPAVDDPVAKARAEVERLNAAELRFALIYRERSVALAEVRAKRGRQVLDASDPTAVASEVNSGIRALEDELAAIAEAASEARKDRLQAIHVVFIAEAEDAERRAAQLDEDAVKLEAESGRLRAALEKHDDWQYVPLRAHGDAGPLAFPRHDRLRTEVSGLRTQAAQGRFKVAHQAGGLEADTIEDLFGAVHSDAMRIGPTVDAINVWAEQAFAKERRRRERIDSTAGNFLPLDAPMRMYLEWRGGVIDAARSHILEPELVVDYAPPVPAAKVPASPLVRRAESDRSPFDTGPKPYEIKREAAATGQSIEDVAKAWGVPVPKPEPAEAV